jgi:death-on-curing protein
VEIRFLTLQEVLRIHEDQIERYGGSAGIRDVRLLESAAAMPSAGFGDQYLHEDIFAMAAAYLFHIAQNHPFVDGNKRVGTVAAATFLTLNGIFPDIDESTFEGIVRAVAQGQMSKADVAAFLRERLNP